MTSRFIVIMHRGLKSANGSLQWIARQCRIEFCYRCRKLQSVAPTAQVKHLEACNIILKEAKETAEQGVFDKAGAFDFQGKSVTWQ